MRRLARWSLVVVSSSIVALVAVISVSVTWNDRADDICREQAPRTASDYSSTWDWAEFAYVCDYGAPDEDPRRVGIIDAFHGEGSRRHRPDR
jgi:hypothetical protein